MRRFAWMVAVVLGAMAVADDKGTVVSLDGLKAAVPAGWKVEKPGQFRLAQFVLPRGSDDKEDTDVVIFKGLGGGVRANLDRWKNQFAPAEGKVTEIKIGGRPATQLDIEGTYQTAPFDPKYKGRRVPGFRMIAVYFDGPEDVYQIKLTGPAKNVAAHKKAFEDWLKAFK